MSDSNDIVNKILGNKDNKEDVAEKILGKGKGRGLRLGPKDGSGPNVDCSLKK